MFQILFLEVYNTAYLKVYVLVVKELSLWKSGLGVSLLVFQGIQ